MAIVSGNDNSTGSKNTYSDAFVAAVVSITRAMVIIIVIIMQITLREAVVGLMKVLLCVEVMLLLVIENNLAEGV